MIVTRDRFAFREMQNRFARASSVNRAVVSSDLNLDRDGVALPVTRSDAKERNVLRLSWVATAFACCPVAEYKNAFTD
jgi:hypothetical protein